VHGDLLVPLDAETSNGVPGLRLDGLLVGEILEHLGSLGQLITGLTSAQVKNELLNSDFSHFIVELRLLLIEIHVFFFLSKLNLLIINTENTLLKQ